MRLLSGIFAKCFIFLCCCVSWAPLSADEVKSVRAYNVTYSVTLVPERQGAQVKISIDKGEILNEIRFSNKQTIYTDIRANGKLTIKGQDVVWELPAGDATLTYFVSLTHERSPGKFDSRMTADWALFRGDDLIPAIHSYPAANARHLPNSYSIATLEFELPKGWKNIETGWPRKKDNIFNVDNPGRRFDRPTGWMIAGKIGTRRATVLKTSIAVSAPIGQNFQRMDALTFFNFVWPEVHAAFKKTPKKLLVVGAGDPMWRGGLSASNSLFLHTDRPLVSENGTSPLLHELTHMVTRISAVATSNTNDDWIAEGLAEFYSFELLYRADGITKSRRNKIIKSLAKWGAEVKHLRKNKSTGPVTARAVVLLDELDKEIRKRSNNQHDIDDVVRDLMEIQKVSLDDLRKSVEKLIGPDIATLKSPLLK